MGAVEGWVCRTQNTPMSPPNPKICMVLMDADGVLQRSSPHFIEAIKGFCPNADCADDFVADVFAAEKPCLTGDGDFADALAVVLKKWQSPYSVQEALQTWSMIEPDPDVLAVVQSLRQQGTKVALATNQQQHRAQIMLYDLGYVELFDRWFCSYELGFAKPDPAYFRHAVAQAGYPAEQLLLIDDHPANVHAARDVGLCAGRFHLDEGMGPLFDLLHAHNLLVG